MGGFVPLLPFMIPIVAVLTFSGVALVAIFLIARAIGKRGVVRRELQELKEDISQIKNRIEDIREQLADIIIRLG